MKRQGKELVTVRVFDPVSLREAQAAAREMAPVNVVGREVSKLVEELPKGIYRTHVTVCRIEYDADGNEKSNRLVSSHSFDFDSKPKALPPAPAAGDETRLRCREAGPLGGNRCRLVAGHQGPHEAGADPEVKS
jgi:hypothetical protein